MSVKNARFCPGQTVCHRLFEYRGVIVDVDPVFMGTQNWYNKMALSRPPKERPWYRVLVHNTNITAYVAERNLCFDQTKRAVSHPEVKEYFTKFRHGIYEMKTSKLAS